MIDTTGIKTEFARKFISLYRGLRARSGSVPRKDDLTPEFMLPIIGSVYIIEATDQGYLFRLIGTKVAKTVGVDNTGKYLHEFQPDPEVGQLTALLDRCRAERMMVATIERLIYPDRAFVEVEVLRTPWADETGEVRFVAGTFAETGFGPSDGPKIRSSKELRFERENPPHLEEAV